MRIGLRQIIFILLLLATPVTAYFSVFAPRNRQIAEARREIGRKQNKLKQLENVTHSIADVGREIDKLSQAIELFEQKLPAEREVEIMLRRVWELAARHSLTPKSVRTDKPVISAQYSELPIKMIIIGNFDGFYSFMLDLEKLRRITRMPKMELTRLTQEQGQMKAQVLLSIFYESPGTRSAAPRREGGGT